MWPWPASSWTCKSEQATRNGLKCARVSRQGLRQPESDAVQPLKGREGKWTEIRRTHELHSCGSQAEELSLDTCQGGLYRDQRKDRHDSIQPIQRTSHSSTKSEESKRSQPLGQPLVRLKIVEFYTSGVRQSPR